MKKIEELVQKLRELKEEKYATETKHSKLHQIDMLSGEGESLRAKINQLQGGIDIIMWILKQ